MEKEDLTDTLEMQVWNLCLRYTTILENCGYSEFTTKKPEIAVEHVLKRVAHPDLKNRLLSTLKLNKDKGYKKNFKKFVKELAQEARFIDRINVVKRLQVKVWDSDEEFAKRVRDGRTGKERKRKSNHANSRNARRRLPTHQDREDRDRNANTRGADEARKRARDFPDCLNPKCTGKHFINDCAISTSQEKSKYKNEYHEKKRLRSKKIPPKGKRDGVVGQISCGDVGRNTSIFSGTFCDGAVNAVILADQGADGNVISTSTLRDIQRADPDVKVMHLKRPYLFGNASSGAPLIRCTKWIQADCLLRVRHSPGMILRKIKWFVSEEDVEYVYLGRHVLAALGLDNQKLMAAAHDRLGSDIDVPEILKEKGYDNAACANPQNPAIHSMIRHRDSSLGSTFHSRANVEDDCPEDHEVYVDLGEDDEEELSAALRQLVVDGEQNGLSNDGCRRLSRILKEFRSVFRLRLGKTKPADVPPMRIRLEPGHRPIRVKARRYPPDQRQFLDIYVQTLREMDFFVDLPTAELQAAPLLVPKRDSKAKYRMAVDLRPINAATIKESWPMPHLDSEIGDFAGSTCFAIIDFVSGYWQLPLHPESYPLCGVVTPKGVVASKRVLPGLANATSYFQSTVEPLFSELRDNLKAWLDDFSLHAKDETTLLNTLEAVLKICTERGLYLSARKCRLFRRELKWCGRVISPEGYRMDPARLSGLQDMEMPKTAAELAQFIYCCRWMSIAIPNLTERMAPLVAVPDEAYAKAGKRTKRSIRNIKLHSLSWGPVHETSFQKLQDSLRSAVKLAYPDLSKAICVFTDASERFWSGVVTQTRHDQLQLHITEQKHEPVAFLGAAFKNASRNWTTFEKEAFAVFQTFEKLDYLFLGRQDIRVFTDHRNLLFIFAPLALEPSLGRHIISKVQRWALYMSRFHYVIEHVKGEENVFADMLTRWTRGYRNEAKGNMAVCSMILQDAEQLIPAAESFEWPDIATIRQAQQRHERPRQGLALDTSDGLWKKDGRIWIPKQEVELQLKIMVASHSGSVGHRGKDATLSILSEDFWWPDIVKDTDALVRDCLHCLLTRAGDKVPRPLGHALHGAAPNEVVHMDFLYMGRSTCAKKYILLIRDDLSGYVWLWPSEAATAECAAEALCIWFGVFGSMDWLVSDQGAHFKNELIRTLTAENRVHHHFTTAYCPWANGSVERICREVLRACKVLLSKWSLAPQDWPSVIEAIQSILNHAPLKRLGPRSADTPAVYRTPLEVFTGHRPVRPLLRAVPILEHPEAKTSDEIQARRIIQINELQCALEQMHHDVSTRATGARKRQVDAHNRRTNVHEARFDVGDFVFVRRASNRGHKLQFSWCGPRRITKVRSEWVYDVENILNGKQETVHARRLHLYRADMDGKEIAPSLLQAAEHTETRYEIVQAFRDIRETNAIIEVQVEWQGLPDDVDLTWEPLTQVYDDLPGLLEDFLHTAGKRDFKRRALEQLHLSPTSR